MWFLTFKDILQIQNALNQANTSIFKTMCSQLKVLQTSIFFFSFKYFNWLFMKFKVLLRCSVLVACVVFSTGIFFKHYGYKLSDLSLLWPLLNTVPLCISCLLAAGKQTENNSMKLVKVLHLYLIFLTKTSVSGAVDRDGSLISSHL